MQQTTDYSLFKKHKSNRELNSTNIEDLKHSITNKNFLKLRPILVDKEMNVIDGQHRLEVAKQLNVPIYYEMSEKLNSESMVLLNANQLRWTIVDYLNHYANEGKQSYILIKEFIAEHKCSSMIGLILFGFTRGGNDNKSFKKGIVNSVGPEDVLEAKVVFSKYGELKAYLQKKMIGDKAFFSSSTFCKSFVAFMNVKNVRFEFFMQKIPFKLDILRPCLSQVEYLKIFREIYNFRNHNPVNLEDQK